MNKKYERIDRMVKLYLDKRIYSIESCMKAAYAFIENYYIFLEMDEKDIIVEIKKKDMSERITEEDIGEFYNELLNQSVREIVYKKTKNIREIIMARALHSECLSTGNVEDEIDDEGYKLENIAHDWFEVKNEERN
ncbi:His-Xaa-Ser system protein HxsD [Sporanaerobacter sp. PP17-6a]|uniref:His-Xaa-Ser system protein HxsD n=1 Tax=Sporanaerobacter sp. PP17-6a TaxID=1891289 RepID=UPI00089F90C3|nr:His-Xaa-Ser system protein HxsD [Sporanaerobacter sp. PP17-6a]SCL81219.1 His-Xaa-Ser system protein HsxD [Sporanaerobacter sp. PP17-6a]